MVCITHKRNLRFKGDHRLGLWSCKHPWGRSCNNKPKSFKIKSGKRNTWIVSEMHIMGYGKKLIGLGTSMRSKVNAWNGLGTFTRPCMKNMCNNS